MQNDNGLWGTDGIFGVIIFLIIAGMFGFGNGFGNGYANGYGQISNDFLYTNLANQVRDNGNAINLTDRDVLEAKYDNSIQTQVLSNQMSKMELENANALNSCCCTLRQEASANTQKILDAITTNRIADLEKELSQAQNIIANTAQTNNILGSMGRWYPYTGVNPYNVYGYNGTTIA